MYCAAVCFLCILDSYVMKWLVCTSLMVVVGGSLLAGGAMSASPQKVVLGPCWSLGSENSWSCSQAHHFQSVMGMNTVLPGIRNNKVVTVFLSW